MILNAKEIWAVDTHAHVYALDTKKFPRKKVTTAPPPEPSELGNLIHLMKTHHVEKTILVQPSYYGDDNSYILHCVSRHPGSLRAVVIAHYNEEDGWRHLEDAFSSPLVCGARFNIVGEADPAGWAKKPNLHNLLKVIKEAGKIAVLHVDYCHLDKVCDIAERYPAISFIIDHMGYPVPGTVSIEGYRQLFKKIGKYLNIFVKISGMEMRSKNNCPFADMADYACILKEILSVDRLLWASNYPYVLNAAGYADVRDWPQQYIPDLTDEEIKKIFRENAIGLFWKERK